MDLKCLLQNVSFFCWTNHGTLANVCANENNNICEKRKCQATFGGRSIVQRANFQIKIPDKGPSKNFKTFKMQVYLIR